MDYRLDNSANFIEIPFDDLLADIDATQIPVEFIQCILVYYRNGETITLDRDDIDFSMPVSEHTSWNDLGDVFTNVREVKVYLNTDLLESVISSQYDELFRN